VVINRVGETIKVEVKVLTKKNIGYYELKKNKTWFVEGCRILLDRRKDAKLLWFEHPSKIFWDNLNNITRQPDGLPNLK
jgi:hypothetical protein